MVNATFRMNIIGRGGRKHGSAIGSAAYASGEKLSRTLNVTSMVAAASYRSGQPLHDKQQNITFDYSQREDVIYTAILMPEHIEKVAPQLSNREILWNEVEMVEKRKDSQLARSLILSLPREISIMEQNIALVEQYATEQFTVLGMIVDLAIHNKQASDGLDNPHCHMLLTMREVTEDGDWGKKNRDWNHRDNVQKWREAWGQLQNTFLEEADSDARIDMRSYQERGINKIPQIHHGPTVQAMIERGEDAYIAEENNKRYHENLIREMVANIPPVPPEMPTGLELPSPFHQAELQAQIAQERAEAEEREAWEIAHREAEQAEYSFNHDDTQHSP